MKTTPKTCMITGTLLLTLSATSALAQHDNHHDHTNHGGHKHNANAPVSIMGDHTHNKGEWMVSYGFHHMNMEGNRRGKNGISPQDIATTISNPNGPPSTLRVVPTEMTMNMHIFGAMYGVTDRLTLMGMAMYKDNEMEHLTFAGGTGTTELGRFTTRSRGWGDTSLSGIYKLYARGNSQINLTMGISAPTGSIIEEDDVLATTGATPTLRLPYAMQLGSGTWDALPGLTYTNHKDQWSWGAQYRGVIRLESANDEGYRHGHRHMVNAWGGYQISSSVTATANLRAETQGRIKGSDDQITAPVQTADPSNYGGERASLGAGFIYTPQTSALRGLELGVEATAPIYQNLNGVQMEQDWNIGTRITFRF